MASSTGFLPIPGAFDKILQTDPRAAAYVESRAILLKEAAIKIFNASQRSDNEQRKSEYTPPKYVKSFRCYRLEARKRLTWRIHNTDPGASKVEYGAHAGGKTFVLRYKPLTRALELVGMVE